MRIRQVRPEFFTDSVTAHLSPDVALIYIGLWCVADDAGWFRWDVPELGATIRPYQSVPIRDRRIKAAGEALVAAGRLIIHECGCAHIPTLVDHQRIGGNKSFTARDEHRRHTQSGPVHTDLDVSAVTLGNGKVGNGSHARKRDDETESEFRSRVGRPAFMGGDA